MKKLLITLLIIAVILSCKTLDGPLTGRALPGEPILYNPRTSTTTIGNSPASNNRNNYRDDSGSIASTQGSGSSASGTQSGASSSSASGTQSGGSSGTGSTASSHGASGTGTSGSGSSGTSSGTTASQGSGTSGSTASSQGSGSSASGTQSGASSSSASGTQSGGSSGTGSTASSQGSGSSTSGTQSGATSSSASGTQSGGSSGTGSTASSQGSGSSTSGASGTGASGSGSSGTSSGTTASQGSGTSGSTASSQGSGASASGAGSGVTSSADLLSGSTNENAAVNSTNPVVSQVRGKNWRLIDVRVNNRSIDFDRARLTREGYGDIFTLTVDNETIRGTGAPNLYAAHYAVSDRDQTAVRLSEVNKTLMTPIHHPERLREQDYFVYIQNIYKWEVSGGNLVVNSKSERGTEVVLIFSM